MFFWENASEREKWETARLGKSQNIQTKKKNFSVECTKLDNRNVGNTQALKRIIISGACACTMTNLNLSHPFTTREGGGTSTTRWTKSYVIISWIFEHNTKINKIFWSNWMKCHWLPTLVWKNSTIYKEDIYFDFYYWVDVTVMVSSGRVSHRQE